MSQSPSGSSSPARVEIQLASVGALPLLSPGTCFYRRSTSDAGPQLQPPADASAIAFSALDNSTTLELSIGAYDFWIDAPGFSYLATSVEVTADQSIVATLQKSSSVTVLIDGDRIDASQVTFSLKPTSVESLAQSYTHLAPVTHRGPSGTWDRLPAGSYVLEIESRAFNSLNSGQLAGLHVTRDVRLAAGEAKIVKIPSAELATDSARAQTGLVSIPLKWWDGRNGGLSPQVSLFAEDERGTRTVRAVVDRMPSSERPGFHTYGWSASPVAPGEYCMRIDPVNAWKRITVNASSTPVETVIGNPSTLALGFWLPGSQEVVRPSRISLGPAQSMLTRNGDVWTHHTGLYGPEPIHVAQGQQLSVWAMLGGEFLTQELDLDVSQAECKADHEIVVDRGIQLRLTLNGRLVPRSPSWWAQNLSIRDSESNSHVQWSLQPLPKGEVELRIPRSRRIHVVLGHDDRRNDVVFDKLNTEHKGSTSHEFAIRDP